MTLLEISHAASGWCVDKPFVRRAWIFGSRVRCDNREDSDIDIALDVAGIVRFESGYSAFAHDHKKWQADIQSLFPFSVHLCHYNETIDRVVDKDNPGIKAAVDKEGILIYDASKCSTAKRFVRLDVQDVPI